ncbi:hypothetical protein HWV62_10068 [Athelia sp. TMB]|nr:hypothetical protein HWV62_10068 [Athelia sp. TMB]
MSENTPILVAPRPVRIASDGAMYLRRSSTPFRFVSAVTDRLERARIGEDIEFDDHKATAMVHSPTPEKEMPSPRSSPSLPSEALEEFLSILRPSAFFPSSSPILRTRRNGASLAHFPYQFKARVLHSRGDSISLVEEMDSPNHTPTMSTDFMIERGESGAADHERSDSETPRWFTASALSSPVSRIHTRNPFVTGLLRNGQLTPSPISPRAIPLPSPSPEEMVEVM